MADRTGAEIADRIETLSQGQDDFLGFERSTLMEFLPFSAAKPFLKAPEVTEEQWETRSPAREVVLEEMRKYMIFALGKAADHRGLSAGRSVSRFAAWTWMLGDEEHDAINWSDYGQYGATILKAVCERYGFPIPEERTFLNMAKGLPCTPGCDEGCGR